MGLAYLVDFPAGFGAVVAAACFAGFCFFIETGEASSAAARESQSLVQHAFGVYLDLSHSDGATLPFLLPLSAGLIAALVAPLFS